MSKELQDSRREKPYYSTYLNLIAILLLCCNAIFAEEKPDGVTYELTGGRLGNNLISYLHAKWVSYKYQIPLYYKPFPYSDELVLDDCERLFPITKGSFLNMKYSRRCV